MTAPHKADSSSEKLGASGWTGRYRRCCSLLMGNCAGVQGNAEINPSFSAPNSSGTTPPRFAFAMILLDCARVLWFSVWVTLCTLVVGWPSYQVSAFLDFPFFSFLGVALLG